ncbi:MAG: cytochrome c/FTR1 family iron permease [Burkholderiales bacterium]
MDLRYFAILVLACTLIAPATAQQAPNNDAAQTIVHLLDYVGVDYPEFVKDGKVVDESEYAEQLEFSGQVIVHLGTLPENPAKARLSERAATLKSRIEVKAPGAEVAKLAGELRWDVIEAYRLAVAPKRAPDLARAEKLYAADCAVCHGARGMGDGPAAPGMDPAPANFHDAARMASRSVYGLYSTIGLGVTGTPMVSFKQLPENDRWALAFYVSTLGTDADMLGKGKTLRDAEERKPAFPNLRELATLTDNDVKAKYGDGAAATFAWLRANPSAVDAGKESPLAFTERLLEESLAAYRAGDAAKAQQLAVTGYLEGFELVEASLDTVDRDLRQAVETQMILYRNLLRTGAPVAEVEEQVERIRRLLDATGEKLEGHGITPMTAAVSAFFIIVREGLEALLVVAAIVAFLTKAGRREALPFIHAGWIGALALGGVTWFVASYVISISGAGRELTEGITALFAAAILVYVGFWLHGKAYADRWRGFINTHLKDALAKGTLWALAGVSFLAVYREAFETVLFYQALWQQTGADARGSVVAGFVIGSITLGAVGWIVFRLGMRLPIGPFFAASSWLLAVLAVIFVGHGVKALQEAGAIAATPVGSFTAQPLGIYPTTQTLVAQAVLLVILVVGFAYGYITARAGRAARV